MTDLSELLDDRMNERMMKVINDLDFEGFKALIRELLAGIGVKVVKETVTEDAVFYEGIGEDGKYFVVASRLFDNASIESMTVLKEMAEARNAMPVLVVTCDLEEGEKRFAESKNISYADKSKLLMLLRKYDLAGKMMAEVDRRILDEDRNRFLPSSAQFDSFFNSAEEHFRNGRYRDAIYNFDRALDIKPMTDQVWIRKANVFFAMGRYNDALVACKRASELRPGDAATWYLMGLVYNKLEDYEKELKAYDTALRIQPRMEAALLNKGASLFHLHRYDWALKVYEEMCKYYPKDAMAFNNKGIVLKAMVRTKEALEAFDKAIFLNRDYIDPVINTALVLMDAGRYDEAIVAWKEALRIENERADIWYSLGMAQRSAGRLEDAEASFETATSLDKELGAATGEGDEPIQTRSSSEVDEGPAIEPAEALDGSISEAMVIEPVLEEPAVPVVEPVETLSEPIQEEVPMTEDLVVAEERHTGIVIPDEGSKELPTMETYVDTMTIETATQGDPVPEGLGDTEPEKGSEGPGNERSQLPAMVERSDLATVEADMAMVVKGPIETAVAEVETQTELAPVEPTPVPAIVERSDLATVEADMAMVVKGPIETAVAEVETQTELAPVEPTPVPAIVERSDLATVEADMAMVVKGPIETAVAEVETQTELAPVEPTPVPAIVEGTSSIVKKEGAPLAAIGLVATDLVVQEGGASENAQAPFHPEIFTEPSLKAVPGPFFESEAIEPEIPIADRGLKAAILLNILGENERALKEIDIYIAEKPEGHDARHVKANILDDLGNVQECLEELKEAIRLDPKDDIALMDIESISWRLGRKEESLRILASIRPNVEVRAREAVGQLELKRSDEVATKRSMNAVDAPSIIKVTLALSLMGKGKYREASKIWFEVIREHPANPEALNNLGVCMRFMGEYGYEDPLSFMRLAVEADPNYGDAWNNIGATLFVVGDYAGAIDAIKKALTVDRRADYLVNLSKCQIMVGDIAGAKLSLTSALKYEETAEIDFALALIAEKEGEMKWAMKLYDSAIALAPNFKDAMFNRQRVRLFLKYTQK